MKILFDASLLFQSMFLISFLFKVDENVIARSIPVFYPKVYPEACCASESLQVALDGDIIDFNRTCLNVIDLGWLYPL